MFPFKCLQNPQKCSLGVFTCAVVKFYLNLLSRSEGYLTTKLNLNVKFLDVSVFAYLCLPLLQNNEWTIVKAFMWVTSKDESLHFRIIHIIS